MEINVEFLTYEEFKKMGIRELIKKIRRKDSLVIINKKLSPKEEAEIIEETMKHIDERTFKGIEIASISKEDENNEGLRKILKKIFKKERGITLIGSSKHIKEIKNKKNYAVLRI